MIAVALVVSGVAAAQQPTFRGGVNTVPVYVTITSRTGEPVPTLEQRDFDVFDNGRLREITVFSRADQPVTAVLLLDLSNSGPDHLRQLQEAGAAFVEALRPGDRARIGTFGTEVTTSPLLTGDKAYLLRVLFEELWPGGNTLLWNGVDQAMSSLAHEPGRRVIIVFTDGPHLPPPDRLIRSQTDVAIRSAREHFMVYGVGFKDWVFDTGLKPIAASSGGGYFELKVDDDLGETFARIVDELHHQYLLGFVPATLDGTVHQIGVRMRRAGVTIRARKEFVAGGPR